jgi:hypothetical protein
MTEPAAEIERLTKERDDLRAFNSKQVIQISGLEQQVTARDKLLDTKADLDGRNEKEWSEFVAWSQARLTSRSSFALIGDSHLIAASKNVEGLESLLRSVTGSRDAALAALLRLLEKVDALCRALNKETCDA